MKQAKGARVEGVTHIGKRMPWSPLVKVDLAAGMERYAVFFVL